MQTVGSGRASVPFLVADDTSTVRIDPADATLELRQYDRVSAVRNDPSEPMLQRLQTDPTLADTYDDPLFLDMDALQRNTRQDFTERRLDIGDTVRVYGSIKQTSDGGFRSDRVGATLAEMSDGTFYITNMLDRNPLRERVKEPLVIGAIGVCLIVGGIVVLDPLRVFPA